MNKSEHIDQLAKALSNVQAQVKPVAFNSVNPFLKNKYADLGAVIEACKQALHNNGFAVTQLATNDGGIGVETVLMHESGQWISSTVSLPLGDEKGKSLAQVAGSIVTYLRRYALAAIVGLYADEDSDGNSAQQHQTGQSSSSAPTKPGKSVPQPLAKPWYDNALEQVRGKSAVWDKKMGDTAHGNAFIKQILSQHVGDGEWYTSKTHYLECVQRYTGFKSPEEMSWLDADHMIRIATFNRAKVGDEIHSIAWEGIFTAEQWVATCEASGLKLTDKIDTADKAELINILFRTIEMGGSLDVATVGASLGKIVRGG